MISTIKELHDRFEALTQDFAAGRITAEEYVNALTELKRQADVGRVPFAFSPADVDKRFKQPITDTLPANDDNEPYLATLDEIDAEPSSEDEYEDSSSSSEWIEEGEGEEEGAETESP